MRRARPYPCNGPSTSRVFRTINARVPCRTFVSFFIWVSNRSMALHLWESNRTVPAAAFAYSCALVPAPTHVRFRVVALTSGLGMITYLARAGTCTLAPGIVHDLGLTTVQMGYVFTVFQLAYALFEIPTAWWADRQGTRLVVSRIVLWWSCLTAATG